MHLQEGEFTLPDLFHIDLIQSFCTCMKEESIFIQWNVPKCDPVGYIWNIEIWSHSINTFTFPRSNSVGNYNPCISISIISNLWFHWCKLLAHPPPPGPMVYTLLIFPQVYLDTWIMMNLYLSELCNCGIPLMSKNIMSSSPNTWYAYHACNDLTMSNLPLTN